jgi:hypothetical protein
MSSYTVLLRGSEALTREQACMGDEASLYERRRRPNFEFKLGVVGGIGDVLHQKGI